MPLITLALTIGDLNGIGPEVVLKSIDTFSLRPNLKILFVGPADAWHFWAEKLQIQTKNFPIVSERDFFIPNSEKIVILEPAGAADCTVEIGKPSRNSGQIAAKSILLATKLALQEKVDAIVTAPISKSALWQAGFMFPGHTEMLAHLAQVEKPVMLMLAGDFRVAVATTHIALKDVPNSLSTDSIVKTSEVLIKELRERFKISRPRIAVTGLNPHAGESGTLGSEEKQVIVPAIQFLQQKGFRVDGPFPADALFARIVSSIRYDAILAMYHDQGLIPVKIRSGGSGVNYTCGLPFIRTSPDHGTAFDIAGKNLADAKSMTEAVQLAVEIVQQCRTG